MDKASLDSFKTLQTLEVGKRRYAYYSLARLESSLGDLARLPFSLKVLLENLLRHENGQSVTADDVRGLVDWLELRHSEREVAFHPARVLMQDFTGVPAAVDLAAMRQAMVDLGGDPQQINPLNPVDLVIDHSVTVDHYGSKTAFDSNVALEMQRNHERYAFLRWSQQAFRNFRVVPPGTGICHQVNLEYLAEVVGQRQVSGLQLAFPDTLVGTDSHTTMINGLAVLGWGVGGIEAEAAMLGQPMSMLIPDVVGLRLTGELAEGATATDLVLSITQMLREHGVVGKFVEFFGSGLAQLPLADRATIANMAPEYGATCGLFPIDQETLRYLRFTGRDSEQLELVEAYARAQGLWHDAEAAEPLFTESLSLDLGQVQPSIAGPRRPQDLIRLTDAATAFAEDLARNREAEPIARTPVEKADYELKDGDVVIAAITSCTNTSNPAVMLAAGLLARNAVERGLQVPPWVKTSLAPGSQVVTDYLARAGLQQPLSELGFDLVGYGCTTCIGNSGPLSPAIAEAIEKADLLVCSVLSGNRNFEGRINPHVRNNYLASPPLVVAYALAGSLRTDLYRDPIGKDRDGQAVYLRDLWPSQAEIRAAIDAHLTPSMYRERYADVFTGPATWREIEVAGGETFNWAADSTYVRQPPFFLDMAPQPAPPQDIDDARILALLGDSVTTDHISPAGSIPSNSPAADYLRAAGVAVTDFNSFGSRRGNHEVMLRGTFGNIRLRNELAPQTKGGFTRHFPDGETMSIFDAAMRYAAEKVPLIVIAGREYGTGSSRDWAAKGTLLLGVRAVIAESFERIHRSNLVGMGVLPLEFMAGETRASLALDGSERFSLGQIADIEPRAEVAARLIRSDNSVETLRLRCRIDTLDELQYYRNGGILPYVLRRLRQVGQA